jgi:hypothetical protein
MTADRPASTRRRFMLGLGGLAGAVGVLGVASLVRMRGRERLAGILPADRASQRVASAYLAQAPGETDGPTLAARIYDSLGWRARFASDENLRALLAARVRQDFSEDAVVELRGWFLARTEARLATLAALTAPRRAAR